MQKNEPITSPHNRWVKRLRQAIERHDSEIVVEGPKAVDDAIAAGWRPLAVFISEELADAAHAPEEAVQLSRELFAEFSDTVTGQGVLALFERPVRSLESLLGDRRPLTVALDGVQDPGNVGTILRLAAAFDVSGVVTLPGCADPFSPKAIRSSAGAAIGVAVCRATARELLAAAAKRGATVYAAMAGRPDAEGFGIGRSVLVLGSEGRGVSAAIATAARPISIATSDAVESLNVATAAAILLSRAYDVRAASLRGRS